MSDVTDNNDRVREILKRLDEIQRESEFIRDRIRSTRQATPEWPDPRRASQLFDDSPSAD